MRNNLYLLTFVLLILNANNYSCGPKFFIEEAQRDFPKNPQIKCAKARLTLLMGLHPRAGATSNLNVLSHDILRIIAEEYMLPEYY